MVLDTKIKEKTHKKYVFIILTNYMYKNLYNNNILQYFINATYYVTPPNLQNKKYRLY